MGLGGWLSSLVPAEQVQRAACALHLGTRSCESKATRGASRFRVPVHPPGAVPWLTNIFHLVRPSGSPPVPPCSRLSFLAARAWCQVAQKFTGGIGNKLCGE